MFESIGFLIDKLKERDVFKGRCVSVGATGLRLGGRFEAIWVGLNVLVAGAEGGGWGFVFLKKEQFMKKLTNIK